MALFDKESLESKGAELIKNKVYEKLSEHYPEDCLAWVKKAKWTLEKNVPLKDIDMARRPGGRNMQKVENIAKEVLNGKQFEPVFLVKTPTGKKLDVADGYHRTLGTQKAGKEGIDSYVGTVDSDTGPWETEMHEKKLNVEPGKKASEELGEMTKIAGDPFGLIKLANHGLWLWELPHDQPDFGLVGLAKRAELSANEQQRKRQVLGDLHAKEFQQAKNMQIPRGVSIDGQHKAVREFFGVGSTLANNLSRFK